MTEQELKVKLNEAEKEPRMLAALVTGLTREALSFKADPKKWCIHEILGHLADIEVIYSYRMRQILADKEPVIAPIDQDLWALNLGYMQTPPAELVAQFGLMRRSNVRLLRRIKIEDLQKSAFHPELKRQMTLEEWVERLHGHGPNHRGQIEKLKFAAAGGKTATA